MTDKKMSYVSGLIHRARMIIRQIGSGRAILTLFALFAAAYVARSSWELPLLVEADRALYDFRAVQSAPKIKQDSRILIVPYTDDTTRLTYKRSPLDRGILAKALRRLDQFGAKGIAIDILIDQPQREDEELIAAFRSMKTRTFLAFADKKDAEDKISFEQQNFLEAFQARIKTRTVGPVNIVLKADGDDVLRTWADVAPKGPPRIPNAMIPEAKSFENYSGSIVYQKPALKDQPVFASIPIETFAQDELFASPEAAQAFGEQVKDRYVLIGGNLIDIDLFETPLTRAKSDDPKDGMPGAMWGVESYAHMIVQMLDGRLLTPLSNVWQWFAAILVVVAGSLTATANFRAILTAPLVVGQLALIVYIPFALAFKSVDTHSLPAAGWIVGWVLAYVIISAAARVLGSEQRKFAQNALGKYLPPDIAGQILKDPESLKLSGEKREIFALFTDLEGFTKLSHAIEPDMVATLLNRYLELLSNVVLEHGGTIDKFVGDAVVAFWGAPISRPDDGERAVKAAIAMNKAGETFRHSVPQGVPLVGKTRVGLHFGEAIVGNFGGEGRIQYTALGDSMNTAARLESANKQTKSSVLVSGDAVAKSGLDIFRPMGTVVLRGRATPIAIFEPVPEMAEDKRKSQSESITKAIAGDVSAITALRSEMSQNAADMALANLVHRISKQEKGGYFVLD